MSIIKEADPTLIFKNLITFSFSYVFWIDASSVGTIRQGLKGICDTPAAQSSGLDDSPESVLHWIGSLKETYLMVFDNADVLSPAEIEAYLPPGMGGNILITSCNSTMSNLTSPENSLQVTEMEENDAIELLSKASGLDPSSMEFQVEASKIVKELFWVPLAINQAGAYIASGATSIGDYLAKYFEHQKTLLSYSEFTEASKYNRAVYNTWELSYKEIQQWAESEDSHKANAANSAMLLLKLFSFFHHEGITEKVFAYAALQKGRKASNPELPLASSMLDRRLLPLNKAGNWDSLLFREGIWVLLLFSLIKRAPSDGVYAMHPLVHTWGRDRLTFIERNFFCSMAYVTLSSSLHEGESQPYGYQRVLVTHVRATMEHSQSESGQNVVGYLDDAYVKFGDLLWKQGYPKEAETLQIEVLDTRNKILGMEHPDTIIAMADLASTYQHLGKYTEAEKLEMQVLDASNRIFGEEHPNTIHAMGNIAVTYHNLGKYTEAEKLEIQILDARNRILGVEHPETINAMANLAATYHNLGKYTEAEKLKIQVLDARSRILGVGHPETIIAMENLAATYQYLGKYTVAEKLEMQALDASNRIFGEEHPSTIHAMGNIAVTYHNLGKYAEAEKLAIQVLDARNRILGVEHPDTINAMENLAATYHNLGKYTEAEKLEMQVLDARNKILEVGHPETIIAMANLAATYQHLGKYTEAERLEMQVLDASNRIFGEEHPNTIHAMENIAVTYHNLGKYTEAEKLELQVLDTKKRILGVEHPDTINAMANLAAIYQNLGKYTEAERLEMQILDASNRIFGEEDLNTIHAIGNIAVTYHNLGKYMEAEKLEIQVLDAKKRILGVEHPDTINAMANLAVTYHNMGKYAEAEKLKIQVLEARNRTLGVEHPETIIAMESLADIYHNLGEYTKAEKLEIQVLDARNRTFGVKHPETIRAMENLAAIYNKLGKNTEAEKLNIQVLNASNRIFGVNYPDAIRAMANLAATYGSLGRYTESEKLEIQVLDARNRILGIQHPETINAMANLAATFHDLKKYAEAEELEIQVLDARNRILGVEHPDTIHAMRNLAKTYGSLGKCTHAEKLKAQVLDIRMKFPGPEHPDAMPNDTAKKLLQDTVTAKLEVQVLDAGKEVVETEHPHIIGAMTNPAPNGKQLILAAKLALQHLQQCEAEIKVALALSRISEMDYILLAGFNESAIHAGIGYLEEIHVILKSEFCPDSDFLSSLGRIFSPFSGMIFTTCPPYCFQTPVFNSEQKVQEWNEVLYTQAHTYTTLRMGNTMKEMALMSANTCCNEGKVPSGSGSGGGGGDQNEKKQGENMPQGRRIDNDPQRSGEKDSEEDDNDPERDDPDNPDSEGSSNADLPISFTIQTEIYPKIPPVLASGPSSSKPSKHFQLLQLEGSITVQVGFSSKLIHRKSINLVSDKTSTVKTKAPSKLLY